MNRRSVLKTGISAAAVSSLPTALWAAPDPAEPYATPFRYPKLILAPTAPRPFDAPADRTEMFDGRAVDGPVVFHAQKAFYMLYTGFDGTGYQTGLARSLDLLTWTRLGVVGPRNASSKYTRYNVAITAILRDKDLHGKGEAIKVDGQYVAVWHAFSEPGFERGETAIGLARSKDLLHWTLGDPILQTDDGAMAWERGGMGRPDLLLDHGTYVLYYSAKSETLPKAEGGGRLEQIGVATSKDLMTWTRYARNPVLPTGLRGTATYPPPPDTAAPNVDRPDSRDSKSVADPYVVRNGERYAMYYSGANYVRPGRAAEMLAVGADPYQLNKLAGGLLDTSRPASMDESAASGASVIFHEKALYCFYGTRSGTYPNEVRGIAVARSTPWV